MHLVTLKDGSIQAGLIRRDDAGSLVLVNATGQEITVTKSSIAKDELSPLSLMPATFGQAITEADFHHLLAWLESPGTTLLVAQSENGVLGVAVLVTRIVPLAGGLTHKVVEVDNLVVRADQRGRRIGRRLLAAVVEWARQRRAVQVEAVVGEGDAKRFYQSFGFAAANDRLVLAA
jgi:GNAT superfamily N-acetyltransferase